MEFSVHRRALGQDCSHTNLRGANFHKIKRRQTYRCMRAGADVNHYFNCCSLSFRRPRKGRARNKGCKGSCH